MTTYTAIPGTDIDAESPLTENTLLLLRDNPIAMAEGASGAPQFAGTQSALKLLQTVTASNDFSVGLTSSINSSFDRYIINLINVRPTTHGADLFMRLSQSGVSMTSNYYYSHAELQSTSPSITSRSDGGAAQTEMVLAFSLEGTNSRSALNGQVQFSTPDDTSRAKQFMSDLTYENSLASSVRSIGASHHRSPLGAMDGVSFIMSTGNISTGVFRLYGVMDS